MKATQPIHPIKQPQQSIWTIYETEKAKLLALCLSVEEYELEIRKLCARLGV